MGHNYLGTFFASADALLAPNGVMVMQAITTPENRYEEYIRSTDFINTIIFPGLFSYRGLLPSFPPGCIFRRCIFRVPVELLLSGCDTASRLLGRARASTGGGSLCESK